MTILYVALPYTSTKSAITQRSSLIVLCQLSFLRASKYYRIPMVNTNCITTNSSVIPGQRNSFSVSATRDAPPSRAFVMTRTTNHMSRHNQYVELHRIKSRPSCTLFNCSKIHPTTLTKSFGGTRSMNTNQNNDIYPTSSLSFHFATTDYADSFMKTAMVNQRLNNSENNNALRQQALHYLNQIYDPKLWFNDPVCFACF